LLTPLAALGIAGTMAGATGTLIQKGEPFINPAGHSWENSSFYLALGVALTLLGAGAYSLDAMLFGRASEEFVNDRNPQTTLRRRRHPGLAARRRAVLAGRQALDSGGDDSGFEHGVH
jgi:hypothetical protein